MDIGITANSSTRAAYIKTQPEAGKKTAPPAAAHTQDKLTISPEAQGAVQNEGTRTYLTASVDESSKEQDTSSSAAFTSFADEFNKVTNGYADTVREYYAKEHEENLTHDSPSTHIWNKYKNPESPDFRSDLSEDERAWAYDQELDMLNGGKHLQMGNPYAFSSAGGPPTLKTAAAKAMAASRDQIDRSIQTLFAEHGVEVPEGTSFKLTVDRSSYSIHVTGLEDKDLSTAIEQALNRGDNGKNLYHHLKLTVSDGEKFEVEYTGGHLAPVDTQRELDDSLSEIKKQAGPAWARYSAIYDPHQESMNEKILGLDPASPLNTREHKDRLSAAVRVGAPEVIAEFRARQHDMSLVIDQNREIDPDGSIALKTYMRAYAQPAIDARKTITEYYADAHKENSSYPFVQGLEHIAQKYKRPGSTIFRADLPKEQRDMYYRQERALLTGARVTLFDPYALASVGGIQNAQASHQLALKAVQEKMNELRKSFGGKN